MPAILAVLQVILSGLPEAATVWPVLSGLLTSGAAPTPSDQAALWTAAAAIHARVQAAPPAPAPAPEPAVVPVVATVAAPIG